jgi:hypothetical protein
MKDKRKLYTNILIMVAPILLPAIVFLVILGESFFLFAVPLVMSIFMTIKLAKRLNTKDAIAFSLVQCPFLLLLLVLFSVASPGLGFILILPITFIVNMSIGYIYFRCIKTKRWFTNVLVLLLTIVVTFLIYPPLFALSPEIEYGEFPFRIVYEINGTTHEIEDAIVARYSGIHAGNKNWSTSLKSGDSKRIDIFSDSNVPSVFTSGRINDRIDIWLDQGSAAYYMGDNRGYRTEPNIMYSETYRLSPNGTGTNTVTRSLTIEQLSEHFGIEITTWSFSEPIRNRFTF